MMGPRGSVTPGVHRENWSPPCGADSQQVSAAVGKCSAAQPATDRDDARFFNILAGIRDRVSKAGARLLERFACGGARQRRLWPSSAAR